VGQLALFAAQLVVWVVLGVALPVALGLLSLVFGGALRRDARACQGAAKKSSAAMGRASSWLSGARPGEEDAAPDASGDAGADAVARVRVAHDGQDPLRVAADDDLDRFADLDRFDRLDHDAELELEPEPDPDAARANETRKKRAAR
jgi:hypothetical protein